MFDKEFYPTPLMVLDMMQINCIDKVVLEPSAGKGDIVDYLKYNGAKSVLAIEKNDDLKKIVRDKCQLIGSDFLKCEPHNISHIDMIVMNPPFSNADEHIMHAYNIAPDGCEIIALCNWETVNNPYTKSRKGFKSVIQNFGTSENLGDVFSDAERTTGINIGLVKIYKPISSSSTEFEGFFMDEDEEEMQQDGVMQFNEVRALVQRYVGAMKVFDKLDESMRELEYTTGVLGLKKLKLNIRHGENITTKDEFSKYLQKISWNHIINVTGIRKFTTSSMMTDINNFVEKQEKVPFTMKNVYHMLDMIIQTRGQQFEKALVLAVDEFTKYVKENRYSVEGWHTNLGHMLNQKIIIPDLFERGWNNADYVEVRYSARYRDKLNDLVKTSCTLIGYDYKDMGDILYFANLNKDKIKTGIWYDWGFLEFKAFYKGTMHLKFKNKNHWHMINKAYGESKGFVLPE